MIYLHHVPLTDIPQEGLSPKQAIALYRERILGDFCCERGLPKPIFARHQHGKPYVVNVNLAFNQSHSQHDYVLAYSLAVSDLGVDIENLGRRANFDGLANRYFHADEYQLWQNQQCDVAWWFRLWTIKEAVLKASGLGIRLPLNELKAIFINDDTGYVYHKNIGKFYFQTMVIDACMVTVAYPFEYGDVKIVRV